MPKVSRNMKQRRPTYFRAWRKAAKLTQEQLAERLDVTFSNISQLERGEIGYTQSMLEAMADIFGCHPADLLTRGPDEDSKAKPDTDPRTAEWRKLTPQEQDQALSIIRITRGDQ